MRMIAAFALAIACMVAAGVVRKDASLASDVTVAERNFEFTYLTEVAGLPGGAKNSRIWIPLPQTDNYQTIADLKIQSNESCRKNQDHG